MPDDFICVAKTNKTVLSASTGNNRIAVEKIFTNKQTYEKLDEHKKESIKYGFSEQLSMF